MVSLCYLILTRVKIIVLHQPSLIFKMTSFVDYLDLFGIILLKNLEVETCNPVHSKWKFLQYQALLTNRNSVVKILCL